jgi:hypothetical protein
MLTRISRHFLIASLLFTTVALGSSAVAGGSAFLEQFRQESSRVFDPTKDQAPLALARYGKPDRDDSTAYDQPRPPVVTRLFDYRKAGVEAAFGARDSMRKPPPYTWLLFGFLDTASKEAISFEEGDRRLRAAKH